MNVSKLMRLIVHGKQFVGRRGVASKDVVKR